MRRYLNFIVLVGLVVLLGYQIASSEAEKQKTDDLFKQVKLFSDTLAIIETDYVDAVGAKDLIYGALKGMVGSLDPHSQFMDPDTYNELKVDTEGKFGGLGVEITIKDGLLTIVTPLEDTPAWKAGLKANDRIVKINDDLTRDLSLTDAVKKMRGKPGEAVNLTILRESEKKLLEVKIVRDIIKIVDIKAAKILEDGIAYVRMTEFRENTANELQNVLERLKKEKMNSLILDLRNNPGGLLDVSVSVSEKFLDKGKKIVYTKGRKGNQNLEFFSRSSDTIVSMPMVVLINEGSASASEIVAGALQDHKRAIILGTKSFGKGSVQTVIPLSDGSALRLTTSKYYTPSGREIHGKGIVPDIAVEEGRIELNTEDALKKNEDIFEELENKTKPPDQPKKEADYKTDNQLMRAVDVLKALKIYQGTQQHA
ncbi:MAG: S41 family peptidase [Candidatus Omnitrophica bacterium]|nr:S41 family peptidase [Candidatus Omnitrophota bacterium]